MHRPLAAALALGLTLAPATARAWCLLSGEQHAYANFWRAKFPDLRLPVYISLGPASTLLHTGLTQAQLEAIVQRMIADHNATVSVPTLVYAGTTPTDLDPDGHMRARPAGIVIDAFLCEDLPTPCAKKQLACTTPGGNDDDLVSKARMTLRPGVCNGVKGTWGVSAGRDITRVLLHELGHALGLGHTDDATCPGRSDPGGSGVMNEILGPNDTSYERTWRSDDIAGLRAIYGADIRHRVFTWVDDAFPAAPAEASRAAVCADLRTPPTFSSAVPGTGAHPTLLLGFTDLDDRVSLLEWHGARFVAPVDGAVVDPSEHGRSFVRVGVAHSDADGVDAPVVLVVWSADDSRTSRENRLRWALRPLAGGPWTLGYLTTPSGPTQVSPHVAVGFDLHSGLFLIASVTNTAEPYLLTLDSAGMQRATSVPGTDADPRPLAFDVGRPACFGVGDEARCTLVYTSATPAYGALGDPLRTQWLHLRIADDGVAAVARPEPDIFGEPALQGEQGIPGSQGLQDLAAGPDGQRGVAGEYRYDRAYLDRVPSVFESQRLAGDDWPLRIGSHTPSPDEPTVHIAARRFVAPCGDGHVECDDPCDDDDLPEPTTSSGGPDEQPTTEPGCGCTLAPTPPALLILGLLGSLRRRRHIRV